MSLIVRSSRIHAAGVYATRPIARGSRVIEYTGPRIGKEQADAKYEDSPTTYLFGIGDGETVIDGHGMAMFINHSCEPNCETDEIDGRIWILALRDIAPGEEITYDYNLYDGDEREATCNCGSRRCRGTMYSPDEIARRAREERKRAAAEAKRSSGEARRKKR